VRVCVSFVCVCMRVREKESERGRERGRERERERERGRERGRERAFAIDKVARKEGERQITVCVCALHVCVYA